MQRGASSRVINFVFVPDPSILAEVPRQQKLNHRSVTPIIDALRSFLRGRQTIDSLRYADTVVARNQPPPNVPGGPYHKTSKIYYYLRDARREVQPPLEIMTGKQLTAGSETPALKAVTPNKVYLSG